MKNQNKKKKLTKRELAIIVAISVIAFIIAFVISYHISYNHFSEQTPEDVQMAIRYISNTLL